MQATQTAAHHLAHADGSIYRFEPRGQTVRVTCTLSYWSEGIERTSRRSYNATLQAARELYRRLLADGYERW